MSSQEFSMRTRLPLSRVKKICRLDAPNSVISAEAVQLITMATERFVTIFAQAAYGQANFDKRKTLQFRDIEFCIKNYGVFNFLEGTLDGWPEIGPQNQTGVGETAAANSGEMDDTDDMILEVDDVSDQVFGYDESLAASFPIDGQTFNVTQTTVVDEQRSNENEMSTVDQIMDVKDDVNLGNSEVFGIYGYVPLSSHSDNNMEAMDVAMAIDDATANLSTADFCSVQDDPVEMSNTV